jgi:hypothetical protein
MVTIVVSRYNEDLEWLNDYPFNQFRYVVYNKGVNDDFCKRGVQQVVRLPNVGRCDHTYIYHLVKNYANLHGIQVFFPGSLDIPFKKQKAALVLLYIMQNKRAAFPVDGRGNIREDYKDFTLDKWTCIHPGNAGLNPEAKLTPCALRPFGRWYDAHFGNARGDFLTLHGIFSVAAEDVRQHPVGRYTSLLAELSVSSNPEVGHYMERAWAAVFYPLRNTDKLLK